MAMTFFVLSFAASRVRKDERRRPVERCAILPSLTSTTHRCHRRRRHRCERVHHRSSSCKSGKAATQHSAFRRAKSAQRENERERVRERERERVSTRKGGIFFDGRWVVQKKVKIFKKNSSTQLLRQARARKLKTQTHKLAASHNAYVVGAILF